MVSNNIEVPKKLYSKIKNLVRTRIPTKHGEFVLYYYSNNLDNKEHIALVKGDVSGRKEVPVRVHSECFTGDVIGSQRCDCGDQLDLAMELIGQANYGVLIYLRQEGRGIGLLNKLKAYNLQDQGFDTVDANIRLGHRPDEREYSLAALILRDLNICSVRLITNNPNKIRELSELGIKMEERIPAQIKFHQYNREYLETKARKMDHLLSVEMDYTESPEFSFLQSLLNKLHIAKYHSRERPFITLSYAQSIDGSVSINRWNSFALSCENSLKMTHLLRASHDALLVGVNTIKVDNPQLTVRYTAGNNPQPIILDSRLCIPLESRILHDRNKIAIIITTELAPTEKITQLESLGAQVYRVNQNDEGQVDLLAAMAIVKEIGFTTVMVEGGASVINRFLSSHLVDYCIITLVPKLIGGLKAVEDLCCPESQSPLSIENCQYHQLGTDMIVYGAPLSG